MFFRPPSPIQLPVPRQGRSAAGDCLAACAALLCTYLNIRTDYTRLLTLLEIEPGVGAPFHHIRALAALRLAVTYERDGSLTELYDLLHAGWPIITAVDTGELPHWQGGSTGHVVVVVGVDRDFIYLNAPEFPAMTVQTPLGEFDLAWLAQGEQYAVLAPS